MAGCFDKTVDIVINCAAISQPAVCESSPDLAAAVNVPLKLLDEMQAYMERTGRRPPLLIHLSTDQVYDGSKARWTESDPCAPVNAYGCSKLAAERLIQQRWHHHAILRSSIIYGPQPPAAPVSRGLFIQFVDSALAAQQPTKFFEDEWRSPVFVEDIVGVCRAFVQRLCAVQAGDSVNGEQPKANWSCLGVFNMGGPERLSRVDIAMAVAEVRGYDPGCIEAVPAASVARGVASPSDISMDSSLLEHSLGMTMTPINDALRLIFDTRN